MTTTTVDSRQSPLEAALRRAWVEIDLGALSSNLRALTGALARPEGAPRVCGVVKADAYGHGAPQVARVLEEQGAAWLAVALLEEAAELRRAGVGLPILCLGPGHPEQLPLFRRYRVTPTISSLWELDMWSGWARSERVEQPVHLKVDVGMTRLGIDASAAPRALDAIRRDPRLVLEGYLAHFADAEDLGSPRNAEQEAAYAELVELLTAEERERVLLHLANSAGSLHRPAARWGMVRLGLALYGLDPVGPEATAAAGLLPVMSVRARVVQVRRVAPGRRMGYGGRYEMTREGRVAVLPVGYADGYPWHLGGGAGESADVLLHGRRVPVAGSVSMDLTIVDVTDVPETRVGSEAVLLGGQEGEEISAFELARRAGTIPYEIVCGFHGRLPRRWVRGGRVVAAESPLARRGW